MGFRIVPQHFKWIWQSLCQARHKLFFWILLHDRLNTRNLLGRKQFIIQSYNCATLACSHEESFHHLFVTCPFASDCWDIICPNRLKGLSILETFTDLREKLHVPFFMEIIILAAWSIWIVRNNKIFKNENLTIANWKAIYKHELRWVQYRMKKKHSAQFRDWLLNLVL
jgi:hypothetical protein